METIFVEEVFDPQQELAVVVSEGEPLQDVIRQFAEDPKLRGIFLTDSVQRFAGLLTRHDLLNWASVQLGANNTNVRNLSRREIVRMVFSTRAEDLARGDWRSLGVKISDTLHEALRQMTEYDVEYIPVLDDSGKILGGLMLSQVLLSALRSE